MIINFTPHAWQDFSYWLETDADMALKIKELIKAIKQHPFKGIGKPEPLRHALKGFWSRRITVEHRIVYKVSGKKGLDQVCTIIQCRYHYAEH